MGNILRRRVGIMALSIISSLILCAYVYSNVAALSTTQSNTASVTTTKDVVNVPVKIVDSSNSKYVSGLPEKVTVHLTGPRNLLTQLTNQTLTVETSDLADVSNGKRTIYFTVSGLPSNVIGSVTPGQSEVDIEDLMTSEVNVTGVVPEGVVAEGYRVGNVTVNPEKITLSGSAQTLAKVSSVTATVPSATQLQTQTFTQSNVTVVVKDKAGNLLDVKVSRNVSVTVQLISAEVSVAIETALVNTNSAYDYVIKDQSHAMTSVVNTTATTPVLNAVVDASTLSEGTHVVTVPILAPYGVSLSQIREVTLTVEVIAKQ